MRFLIDGYNLMHAAGYLAGRTKPVRLEPVRNRFLDWLATTTAGRAGCRVVFDAAAAPGRSSEAARKGVQVRFAYQETADDDIERLLAADADPGGLVVVSNDGRLMEAARRRKAVGWGCERFLEWAVSGEPTPRPTPPAEPEKPDTVPADEAAALLAVFDRPKGRRPGERPA